MAASLLSLPDDWACLFGLVVADLKSTQNLPLPEAVERARTMLVVGGWSPRVSEGFAAALIEAGQVPRQTTVLGKTVLGDSLFKDLSSLIEQASSKTDSDRVTIFNSMKNRSDLWWLSQSELLFRKMLMTPGNVGSL